MSKKAATASIQPSHTDNCAAQYAADRKAILFLTGMTEEQYSHFVYETGVEWLTNYTKQSEELTRLFMQEPLIWKWWCNEWGRRDAKNLAALYYSYEVAKSEVLARYRMMHQEVFIRWSPPNTLLNKAYAEAIAELTREINTQREKMVKP